MDKERITIEWLSQSIAEMRKELTELQETASHISKDLNRRQQPLEDLLTIRSEFDAFKLELLALKESQQTTDQLMQELRNESVQKEEDLRRLIYNRKEENKEYDNVEIEADHKMRHERFLRQQIHHLEVSQRSLKTQMKELHFHKLEERVRNLEVEQRRLANANFNISRQVANLDRLHSSMLELLEDVEEIQNKVDKDIPDIRREISKLEFTTAHLGSEQNILREEGRNAAKSMQAMAVSVSTLQDERDTFKTLQQTVYKLQTNVETIRSEIEIEQHQQNKMETNLTNEAEIASNLVEQLQSVQQEYESIINKLPSDCSQVNHDVKGLYLIAPAGQSKPILAHCYLGWTTIQRRFDGSVDFNRSWESYAQGFGSPSGEYWMGNEAIHHLTSNNCSKLKITIQDIYDNYWEAEYSYFYVSSRDDGYRLQVAGYKGNASDALDYQNGMQFSAIDVDRDISNTHCAANYEGGWWFSHCQHANLNGRYNLGLTWFDGSRNEWIAVKSSQILVSTDRTVCSSSGLLSTTSSTTTTSPSIV